MILKHRFNSFRDRDEVILACAAQAKAKPERKQQHKQGKCGTESTVIQLKRAQRRLAYG